MVEQIARGQARAHLSVVRILRAAADGDPGRRADYREAVAACQARAENLAHVAGATAGVASLLGNRGDLRAVHQTGEILRVLQRAEAQLSAEQGLALAPHVLAFASEGGKVITAIDTKVRTALDECVYLVPNKTEGLRGARLDRPWNRSPT